MNYPIEMMSVRKKNPNPEIAGWESRIWMPIPLAKKGRKTPSEDFGGSNEKPHATKTSLRGAPVLD